MNPTNVSLSVVYFSPTGTTKKIAIAIAESINAKNTEYIDITLNTNRENGTRKINSDILILGFPVYEEHIPEIVKKYLNNLIINVKGVIAYCVYGNVAYGRCLKEVYGILISKNAPVLSLGAFIGEHSFAKEDIPIGRGRPDENDMNLGIKLGELSKQRYNNHEFLDKKIVPQNVLLIGRILPRNGARRISKSPIVDSEKCIKCMKCRKNCPTGAINIDYKIMEKKCIRCYACVRSCKIEARKIEYKNPIVGKILLKMGGIKKESIII